MQYLTVHDLIWINTSIIGEDSRYDYFPLEACMAGQYSYGDSSAVTAQAAVLLERLLTSCPFEIGNKRTAFIALLTFLNANGYTVCTTDEDTIQVIQSVAEAKLAPVQALDRIAAPAETPLSGAISLRTLIMHECNHHVEALKALAAND